MNTGKIAKSETRTCKIVLVTALTVFVLAAFTAVGSAQPILTEGFETSVPPPGWTEVVVSGTNPDWSQVSIGSHPTCSPHGGSYMAMFNSFSCSSGDKARLYTPKMNFSGLTDVKLKFWMYHDSGLSSYNDRITIQVSTNNATWSNLTTFQRYNATTGWQQHTVDLSAYAGNSSVWVGFLGISDYGNDMYIDDVEIGPPMPDLVITENAEEWVNATYYNVNYTVCNVGNGNANASNTTIYIDGVNSLEDPVPALAPSACDTDTVGPFRATSGSIINVTVCADNLDEVDESDETNNCKTNIFGCGNIPCNCGDICVNEYGWWCNNGVFNKSSTPIQDAVNNASVCCPNPTCADPCVICVKDGAYTENVDVPTANLTIRSENGYAATTVTAANSGDHVFDVTADCVTITGFTVTGATDSTNAGIHLGSWSISADHCNISYNKASGNYHGIYVGYGKYNDIIGNTVNNNDDDGIYVKDDHNNINSNTVNNNGEDGIQLYYANYCNVTGNVANNNTKYGINLYYADYNNISNNTVNYNEIGGIYLRGADYNEITNMSAGNTVMYNKYGIYLYGSSNNNITCNLVAYNTEKGFYLSDGGSGWYPCTGNNISRNCIIKNGDKNPTTNGWEWNFHNYQTSTNVIAENNYWGTTNPAVIAASIKEDSGTVDHTPFLNNPDPCQPELPEEPPATLYFAPQDSSASRYCNETVVQVRAHAPFGINGSQFAISYDSSCAKIVDVQFNPVWTGTWNSTCYGPGVDWITFSNATDQGPGDVWLFNITIHCEDTGCSTDLNFTCGSPCGSCPIELRSNDGALGVATNNGTFTCGADLTVTSIDVNPTDTIAVDAIYVNESNEICAVVHNNGPGDVLADQSFDVCFAANDTYISCVEVTGGLKAGNNTTVCINWTPDCTNYPVMPGYPAQSLPVTINVTADCNCTTCPSCPPTGANGRIDEVVENNNMLSKVIPIWQWWYDYYGNAWKGVSGVVNNGYKSKNFDCDPNDPLSLFEYDQMYGGVVYNVSGVKTDSAHGYPGYFIPGATATRVHHIDIPSGMTVKKARLYVYWYDYFYSYKDSRFGFLANLSVNVTNSTGGYKYFTQPDAAYTDQKGFGKYNNPKGTYAYDVTDVVNGSGDYTVTVENIEPWGGNTTVLLGELLLVVYEDPSKDENNHIQLWIMEGCDYLMADHYKASSGKWYNFSVTPEEATSTVTFTGAIDPNANNATLITVVSQGQEDGANKLFNGVIVETNAWNEETESKINVDEEVFTADQLAPANNTVGFQDNGTSGMQASNAILIVQIGKPGPTPTPPPTPTPTPTPKPVPAITPLGFIVALVSLLGLAAVAMREMHKR